MMWTENDLKAHLAKKSAKSVEAKDIKPARAKKQNKTELRFESEILQPLLQSGEMLWYDFEKITLKLADGVRYTPDYMAVLWCGTIVLYEIKGGKIWDDARVKFLVAREEFPMFEFHCQQYKKRRWTEIWRAEK